METVLVVDDNPEFLGVARHLLEGLRAEIVVRTATCGTDALAVLADLAPATGVAFVILDYRLPDMDAPEVLRRLRAQPGLASLPVLVLSQAGWPDDARAALAAGASAFVVKPSRASALRRVIADFRSRHAA